MIKRNSLLIILCVFLRYTSSYKDKLQSQTVRSYPPQWQQISQYSMKYLNSEYTIKQRGSDLLALSSLLIDMGYDMYPPKLNAYIVEKNGTFDKGQLMITYYPGSIINWDGFKEFQLEYMGQYDKLEDFTEVDIWSEQISEQFGVIVQINDKYNNGQIQRPQSQYAYVHHYSTYEEILYINNPNNPTVDFVIFSDVKVFIVFKKKYPTTYTLSCTTYQSKVVVLTPQGPNLCFQIMGFQFYQNRCQIYVKISQDLIVCHSCRTNYYFDEGQCSECPYKCQLCRKNQNEEIQCQRCVFGYMNSPSGCIISHQNCKQVRHTQNKTQCLECYDGYILTQTGRCSMCGTDCYKCQNYTNCLQCYAPYNLVNGACQIDISYDKTLGCSQDLYYDYCQICLENYTNIGGRCIDCLGQHADKGYCYSSYKLRCHQWAEDKCSQCKPEYRGSIFGRCIIDPDQKCYLNLQTYTACSNCLPGYYVNETRQCVPCQNGYTDPTYPYYCLKCKSPESDHNNQCQAYAFNNQCLCSKYALYFILKIQASSHNNFFQNSKYRQSKLNEALAFYLEIEWFSIISDSFEFIKSGDEAYYVFVGHILLTVGNFQSVRNLQNIQLKLKSSIFDFYDFPIISVFAETGPLNKQKVVQREGEQIQPEQQVQQISNIMIAAYIFGGMAAYILVIFVFNLIKNKIKNYKKPAKLKSVSEINIDSKQRQMKEQQSKRKFEIDLVSIADEDL